MNRSILIFAKPLFLSMLIAFAVSCSNKHEEMTATDYVNLAQEKIDNCKSGHIRMKYTESFDNISMTFESVSNIDFYFIKDSTGRVKSFYSTINSDTINTENLFIDDTLMSLNKGIISRCYYSQDVPLRHEYRMANNGILAKILEYDSISCADTIINGKKAAIISADKYGKTSWCLRTHTNQTCIIDSEGNLISIASTEEEQVMPKATATFRNDYDRIDIEEITLYDEINPDIENLINGKHSQWANYPRPEKTPIPRECNPIEGMEYKSAPEKAFDWQLPTFPGDTLSTSDIKAKIMFAGFYGLDHSVGMHALYCMKQIDSIYNDDDVCVVGFNIGDENEDRVKAILESCDIHFSNVKGKSLFEQYGFPSYINFLIIDCATNEILYYRQGLIYGVEKDCGVSEYKKMIDEALNKK